MSIITLDLETFYDKDYSLSKLQTEAYIRSPFFEVILVSIKVDDQPAQWFSGTKAETKAFLERFEIHKHYLLAHNTIFDGSILAWHFGIRPRYYLDTLSMARPVTGLTVGGSLAKLAEKFNLGVKGTEVVKALGKRRHMFTPTELQDYAEYCINDTAMTYVLYHILKQWSTPKEQFVIDLMLRMFIDPVLELDDRILEKHLAAVKFKKAQLMKACGLEDRAVLMSNPKLAALLEQLGVEPPMKVSPSDPAKMTFAFAKSDSAFKELLEHEDPRVQTIVAARLGVKSTLEETRTQAFINIAERGTLAVPLGYYAAHCVPGDTEVLTRLGWKRLDAWSGGDIAQVYPSSQEIEFLPAQQYAGPVVDEWVVVDAPYMKAKFTHGHTMPYLMHGSGTWATVSAEEFVKNKSRHAPIAGVFTGTGAITPEQMRVLVMVQADGSFETNSRVGRRLGIFLKKPRKTERARMLFAAAGVEFEEQTYPSWPGYVRFIVRFRNYPAWLTPERKFFGPWLLDSAPEARIAFMEELKHWDGHVQGGQLCYSSSDFVNIEWATIIAHLTGNGATHGTEPASGNRRANYGLRVRTRAHCEILQRHTSTVRDTARAYCATTQTGFWLARSQGRIFVTGNTGRAGGSDGINLQNLPRKGALRRAMRAPPGHVLVACDSSSIEARVVAWLAGQDDLVEDFANAVDIYSKFATTVFERPVDRKRIEIVDGKETFPDFAPGFVGKICILGLGYGMGHAKFRVTLRGGGVTMEEAECRRIVRIYRNTYSCIQDIWNSADEVLYAMVNGHSCEFGVNLKLVGDSDGIHLPNGMLIRYPDLTRTTDGYKYTTRKGPKYIYGAKVVENVVQALARIVVFDQMCRIEQLLRPLDAPARRHRVVLTVHDENVICVPENFAEEAKALMVKAMSTPPSWGATLPIACEVGVGKSYGECK